MAPPVLVRRRPRPLLSSHRFSLIAVVGAFALVAAPARADEADDKHQEGTALSKKGEFEAARIKLLQALALRAMPKTLLNLCVVEQQLKLEEEAIRHCRQFVAAKDADPATIKTVQDGLLRELEEVTGRVTIVAAPGTKVEIDGRPVGVAPFPGPLDLKAGERTCSAGGRTVKIVVRAGEPTTVSLVAEAAADKAKDGDSPKAPPPPDRMERGSWLLPGVLAGIGVAGLGVGGGLGLAASGKASSLDAAKATRAGTCGAAGEECQDLQSAYSSGKGLRTGSYIAYGVGGASLLGAVIVTLIKAPWKERPRESGGVSPTLVPLLGPEASGLSLTGAY